MSKPPILQVRISDDETTFVMGRGTVVDPRTWQDLRGVYDEIVGKMEARGERVDPWGKEGAG